MTKIDYPIGCKCAYCRERTEEPSCAQSYKKYKITYTGAIGATWKYIEYEIKVPVCKECSKSIAKHETPFAVAGCSVWVIAIAIALVLGYNVGEGFWSGVFYCIPATMVAGVIMVIIQVVSKMTRPATIPTLNYPILNIFKRFRFTDERPSIQKLHYDTDWPKIKDKFYEELEKSMADLYFNSSSAKSPSSPVQNVKEVDNDTNIDSIQDEKNDDIG